MTRIGLNKKELVCESKLGAYLGPGEKFRTTVSSTVSDPHFDVFDREDQRLIIAKCSRLPDDEDPAARRYGIDFHRALPPFQAPSGFLCDLGDGPVPVNAYTYARYLPRSLRFREFTANLAFAARTREEYEQKRKVYEKFYANLFNHTAQTVIAAPHSGPVRRTPDDHHPFPQSEIDAWTARVIVLCDCRDLRQTRRVLVSLHSTDYFGSLLDIGDFGLPQNKNLREVTIHLWKQFSKPFLALLPDYKDHILPYSKERLHWIKDNFGTVDPQRLTAISTAARFEIQRLANVLDLKSPFTFRDLSKGLAECWTRTTPQLITLNSIFSGRKTAKLIHLATKLKRSGIDTAIQVECSRFLARHHPDLAASVICALIRKVDTSPAT